MVSLLIRSAGLCALACGLAAAPLSPARAAGSAGAELQRQILDVIRKHPEVILESLSRYQQEQERIKEDKRTALIRSVSGSPAQYVAGSPIFGRKSAKTVLFVFADFQCPFCAKVRDPLQQFVLENPDVSLVYKHYPIATIHPEAMNAARASWAAQRQGKFWQFHDILYSNQDRLGEDLYLKAASELGLDQLRFNADRKSEESENAVKRDVELAEGLGIAGTPFFLMNGGTFSGFVDSSVLKQKL